MKNFLLNNAKYVYVCDSIIFIYMCIYIFLFLIILFYY